jgi:hypothetical protein
MMSRELINSWPTSRICLGSHLHGSPRRGVEAEISFEACVPIDQCVQHHIPVLNFRKVRCKNLRSHKIYKPIKQEVLDLFCLIAVYYVLS